ncbi:MAG: DUF433 domain-containing protein [Thermomicrobiales bacterium]|nr:DUF433 domain-containing protein [Thermomicrobiales bacterium]
MAAIQTQYQHIVLDDHGVPRIEGTTMKVVELVVAQMAYGWSPDELAFQFPHLTLGQIHSALAYYWDHKREIDERITRDDAIVDQLMRSLPESPIVERLRGLRHG